MHFRIHVSIMKYLLRHYKAGDENQRSRVPYTMLEEVVAQAAVGGFATSTDKDKHKRLDRSVVKALKNIDMMKVGL